MKIKSLIKHNLMRAAMTLALILACAAAWAETVETYYIDENGTRHDVTATVVTTYMDDLGTDGETTWYVVNENVFLYGSNNQTYIHGNVNLILADGCELKPACGSNGPNDGFRGSGNLTLYGQTAGTGTLSCGQEGFMNITGDFTVCSGMVSVSGNFYNAIRAANFTMRGGSVSITNNTNNDCGIRATGTVNIYSGSVVAMGTTGIEADIVNIYGGSVTARCNGGNAEESNYGRAIQCSSTFNFYGGNVTAQSDLNLLEGQTRYGIYANGINLSWTSTADWINSINDGNLDNVICYFFGSGGLTIAPYKPFTDGNNTYTGTFSGEQVETFAGVTLLQPNVPAFADSGDGTPEHPYTIYNDTGWGQFCAALQDESYNHFSGKTVKLDADITVTQMAGGSNHAFTGTFDGNHKTLTLNYGTVQAPIDAEFVAPFVEVSGGAEFINLNIDGHIYAAYTGSSDPGVGGLIGHLFGGITIEGCTSTVEINSTKDRVGGFVGLCEHAVTFTNCKSSASVTCTGSGSGFVGWSRASKDPYTIAFEGCLFDGKVLKKNDVGSGNGGFVGWKGFSKTVEITNCLVDPAAVAEGETMADDNSATFCRYSANTSLDNQATTITNCYYTDTLGTAQGTKVYSISKGQYVTTLEINGTATQSYTVSGLSFYSTGIKYGNVLYAAENDVVSLTLAHQDREGYDFIGYTATAGNLNGSTLTMPNEDVIINATFALIISYIGENGETQQCTEFTLLTGNETTLGAAGQETWYVADGMLDYSQTINLNGNVHLILKDNAVMNVGTEETPINGRGIDGSDHFISIYGQSTGDHIGTLSVYTTRINCYGIRTNGLTINGGHVIANTNGKSSNALYAYNGDVVINGGIVEATATDAEGHAHAIYATYNFTYTGGIVEANAASGYAINAGWGQQYTFTWRNPSDRITIGSTGLYNNSGNATATFTNAFTDGTNIYSGTLTGTEAISGLAGKTLYPNCVVMKQVEGYEEGNGGWAFIASPVAGSIAPTEVHNLLGSYDEATGKYDYDLYRFNQSDPNGKEWQNWNATTTENHPDFTSLVNGQGYLYATKETRTLVFAGEYTAATGSVEVPLDYDATAQLKGWNLVGNPFTVSATSSQPYYRMNADGTALNTVTEETSVAAMEGVFVQATAANQAVSFTAQTRGGEKAAIAQANIMVGGNNGAVIDNAIIRFDGGQTLEKFSFREGSTKLYIPQDGTDYAIVTSEGQGEMPLNFKVETDGTYTITVDVDNVELAYLHLIDNMTGADVDLLAANGGDARHGDAINRVSTYTFEAKTTDYESRFRLVFSASADANGDNEAFAFIDASGNIIVNGTGTLQVIDMTGRVLYTAEANSAFRIQHSAFPTPGVYVLRLINGENVRTQKIVIE